MIIAMAIIMTITIMTIITTCMELDWVRRRKTTITMTTTMTTTMMVVTKMTIITTCMELDWVYPSPAALLTFDPAVLGLLRGSVDGVSC